MENLNKVQALLVEKQKKLESTINPMAAASIAREYIALQTTFNYMVIEFLSTKSE